MRWSSLPDRYLVERAPAGVRGAGAAEAATGTTPSGVIGTGQDKTGGRAQGRDAKALARKTPFRLTRPEPLEKHIQAAVIARLRLHPRVLRVERLNSGAYKTEAGGFVRFGFPGCPDVVALLKDGRTAWIEVKRPSGRASEAQAAFLASCVAHGIPCGVARSAEDAVAIVEQPINAGTSGSSRVLPSQGSPAPLTMTGY